MEKTTKHVFEYFNMLATVRSRVEGHSFILNIFLNHKLISRFTVAINFFTETTRLFRG